MQLLVEHLVEFLSEWIVTFVEPARGDQAKGPGITFSP